MSQEKVDRYKQQKANRKKIIAREKRIKKLKIFATVVIMLLIVGFFAGSIIYSIKNQEQENATLSEEELQSLIDSLNEMYANTTTAEGDTTTDDETTSGTETDTSQESETTGSVSSETTAANEDADTEQ